jgi:hypothetical protein
MANDVIAAEIINGILKIIRKNGTSETIRQGLKDYVVKNVEGGQVFLKHNKTSHTMSFDILKRIWKK